MKSSLLLGCRTHSGLFGTGIAIDLQAFDTPRRYRARYEGLGTCAAAALVAGFFQSIVFAIGAGAGFTLALVLMDYGTNDLAVHHGCLGRRRRFGRTTRLPELPVRFSMRSRRFGCQQTVHRR